MSSFWSQLEAVAQGIQQLARPMRAMAEGLAQYHVAATVHETSGWLPHRTVPLAQYMRECGVDMNAVSSSVEAFYQEHTQMVLVDIESRLAEYDVDEEAKCTLKEALEAHRHHLYRCSPRVLLPEIERVIREEWLGDYGIAAMGSKRLLAGVDEKHLDDFVLDGPHELVLFDQLVNHLFAYVSDVAQVLEEPTPNRHAAAHGWTAYASPKNSLNAIICADYAFRLVSSFNTPRLE